MNMKDALKESCVIADLKGETKEEVLSGNGVLSERSRLYFETWKRP